MGGGQALRKGQQEGEGRPSLVPFQRRYSSSSSPHILGVERRKQNAFLNSIRQARQKHWEQVTRSPEGREKRVRLEATEKG